MPRTRPLTPPPSVVHVVAGGLLRRLVTNTGDPITRATYAAEIAETLPVSAPTATRAARELIERHLARDGDEVLRGLQGRPEKSLEPSSLFVAVGVSVSDKPDYAAVTGEPGGPWPSRASTVHAVVVGLDGRPVAGAEDETVDSGDPVDLARKIVDVLAKVKWDNRDRRGAERQPMIEGVGVMIGGHVSQGVVRYAPNVGGGPALDLPDLIRKEVAARQLPQLVGVPILMDNDADALARHRTWFGRSGYDSVDTFAVLLLKEDGLGGALVQDGEAGTVGPFEIGHIESNSAEDAPVVAAEALVVSKR